MVKPIRKPRDFSQRALSIVQQATGKTPSISKPIKNPSAVALGRLGGIKGGLSRATRLSASKRSEIARKAARARWK